MTSLDHTLTDVEAFIRRYVVVTDHQAVAVALWVLHTYAIDVADTTPYLAVTSPEKRSGKSLLMNVLQQLSHRPWRVIRPSEAVTFRKIERDTPTLLLDEVDTVFNDKSGQHEGLRALLNAGFQRDGCHVPRCVGPSLSLQEFSTFCAKAIAGIGELPDTVADRSILIRMERKRREDRVERWRERTVRPVAEQLAELVREASVTGVTDWEGYEPELPDELSDRAQDGWEPLLVIADAAGGEWPQRARSAAVSLMTSRDDLMPLGSRLLSDIRDVFTVHPTIKMATSELLDALCTVDESPWGDWFGKPLTARKLANLLRPYGVEPQRERDWRGYFLGDFLDAFSRYLPETVTSVTPDTEVEP